MLPSQPNQSFIDGLACLQALAVSLKPLGCRELARMLDMNRTKVSRLLGTMEHLQLASKTANRKYVAGSGIHVLAAQSLYSSSLLKVALKPLEKLAGLNLTVALGVLWRDSVSYFYNRLPGTDVTDAIGRLNMYPATRSSIGMVLLADLKNEEIKDIYKEKEIPGFPEGIGRLLERIETIRSLEYGYVRETHIKSFSIAFGVGAPYIGAVALSGTVAEPEILKHLGALKETAREINELII